MKFENVGLENLRIDFNRLNYICNTHKLVHAGQWDYERVTFDRRFDLKEGTYYLRVFGYAVEGDIGASDAVIQLMTPQLGKYYYPHGVEYGEDEVFPSSLIETCEKILVEIKNEAEQFTL
ncbi:YugN family protein [Bacillus sp. B190/17]|uniref:YugN family protein n=1 Tax=Bacillus lumedeiriae TaxID=3058829 RepID=A0ABW8I5W4_9BACI